MNPVAPQAVGWAAWLPVRIETPHSANVPYLQGNDCALNLCLYMGSPVPYIVCLAMHAGVTYLSASVLIVNIPALKKNEEMDFP